MTELFLITSVINTGNNPWCYSTSRSFFSAEERFTQTIKTILSIRTKVPNSKIFLVECSDLSEEMTEELVSRVDYFLNLNSDDQCRKACLESRKKGFGEAVQTEKAAEYILENNIEFQRFFKISGRYYLNENFNLENYSLTEFTFRSHVFSSSGVLGIYTVLYAFPVSLFEKFKESIRTVVHFYETTNESKAFEELLPPLCTPRKEIELMGVAGFVAVSEFDFFSC